MRYLITILIFSLLNSCLQKKSRNEFESCLSNKQFDALQSLKKDFTVFVEKNNFSSGAKGYQEFLKQVVLSTHDSTNERIDSLNFNSSTIIQKETCNILFQINIDTGGNYKFNYYECLNDRLQGLSSVIDEYLEATNMNNISHYIIADGLSNTLNNSDYNSSIIRDIILVEVYLPIRYKKMQSP